MENKEKEFILDDSIKEKRKFSSTKRKKIMNKISKINNKKTLKKLLDIIKLDLGNNISKNKNGTFFDMNKLSDDSLIKISDILNKETDVISSESEVKLSYTPYSIDNSVENMGHRFSNKEKNLLKNFNYNKES
jgi:hypothetical protein